jgi:hypothetical protein
MAGDPLAARLAEIAVAPDADRHRLRQRCVEAFAADARYRGDERFARVWLALAAASPDPGAVFDAMARHRVGESLALVWVARAFVAEKAKKFADADALFARGLEMNAKPRELLAKRRREFERRMRRHWLNNQQAPVVPKEPVVREPPTPPRSVDEDATATATQVLALHKAAAPSASFAIFDEAPAAPAASSFAIFDDDAGGVADEAAAGSVRVFEDEAAAPAALAARFDAEARPTPVIFEDAPAAPKPTPGGFRIFEDNSDAPPKPTPALRAPRVAIFEDAAAEAAPRGRVAFAEEISFEERRARVGPQDRIAAVQAPKTARRAFGELQAVDESMVMTNMKPKRLLFSTASKRAPQTLRRAEKEDLTINSAIALREMDSLFGSPASKPPETCRRAIFRDE